MSGDNVQHSPQCFRSIPQKTCFLNQTSPMLQQKVQKVLFSVHWEFNNIVSLSKKDQLTVTFSRFTGIVQRCRLYAVLRIKLGNSFNKNKGIIICFALHNNISCRCYRDSRRHSFITRPGFKRFSVSVPVFS